MKRHDWYAGDWIQTYTGKQFWPLNPDAEHICIEDIAHALSQQCRYIGHCREFYSVAEHSVRVSQIVPVEDMLWGLLHDASEAYLVDIPRPVKHSPGMERYRAAEKVAMAAICERFGLASDEPESVKKADKILLATEMRDLMLHIPEVYDVPQSPLAERIVPWSPKLAETIFLQRFERLNVRSNEVRRGEGPDGTPSAVVAIRGCRHPYVWCEEVRAS